MQREGATLAFTYVNDDAEGSRRRRSPPSSAACRCCPATSRGTTRSTRCSRRSRREWGALDGLLHSIAFAPREALAGDFLDALSRPAFAIAHDVSSYSFAALAKGARPLMQGRAGSLVTLTYLGAMRSVPNYNVMGLAKASLEANVRYLAACLGPEGIRVNGISAGPIKTLAAAGIGDFSQLLSQFESTAPLRRNVTIDEVGNVAAFYFSELSSAITGEITYVDCGFSTIAAAQPDDDRNPDARCASRRSEPRRRRGMTRDAAASTPSSSAAATTVSSAPPISPARARTSACSSAAASWAAPPSPRSSIRAFAIRRRATR